MADGVTDEEILYRSVRQDEYRPEAGQLRILSTAFNDHGQRISFDRANLRTPQQTRKAADQAVFAVTAGEVRKITGVIVSEIIYRVEVIASPIDRNPSHAHVEALPPTPEAPALSSTGFKKLKRELAKIARMELLPASV